MNRWSALGLLFGALAGCGDDDSSSSANSDASQPATVVELGPQDGGATTTQGETAARGMDAGLTGLDGSIASDSGQSSGYSQMDGRVVAADSGLDAQLEQVDASAADAATVLDSAQQEDDANTGPDASSGDAGMVVQPPPADTLTYYRDAKPIIDAKCGPCHYEGGIGPFPLTTYAEVKPFAALIASDVAAGIMPPWRAEGALDTFVGDRRLSDAQKSTLLRWIEQGALEGNLADAPAPLPADRRSLERVDLSLKMQAPYTPQLEPDDYRCFVLEWPYEQTKYVTGISIEPGRSQSVHHAILYLEPPENAALVRAQDLLDPGPGFSCFGNSASLSTWLTSYEPGSYGQSVPDDVGFEIRPGSLMMLQMHYNSIHGIGPDTSRVDFQIADRVAHVGDVAQLVDAAWVLGFMPIPANQPDVVHSWLGRPSKLASNVTYDVHWVDLHMHALGSRGSVSIVRSSPRRVEPLLQVSNWDLNWQETYILREPVKLYPGDQLQVECHFDNTAANQLVVDGRRLPPRDVNWGEGTTDEMCLGNVLVTPAM